MSIKQWDPEVVELIRNFMENQIPFNRYLGIKATELKEGFARLEVPFRPELIGDPLRPAIHGGVLSTLIDTCGGAAAFTLITPPDTLSTIDLRVDYLRPGLQKTLVCEAKVTRLGNYVASVDMMVFHPDEPGVLIATGKGTYNIKRHKGGQ